MNKTRRIAAALLFLLISLSCAAWCFYTAHMLPSQYEYRRWQGDGDLPFSQVSCFLPADGKKSLSDVYGFRTDMVRALAEASADTSGGNGFVDCWSCVGSARVFGERGDVTASVHAVGGEYFAFHPLRLVSGSYISENDLTRDNVLLDEDLAWALFGGNDLEGMTVHLFSAPFRIAGVVARDRDFASRKADTDGMSLYMSYDAYLDLSGDKNAGITCYEVCLPEPVEGYAVKLVKDRFPAGSGEVLENAGRFGFWKLLGCLKDTAARSMHTGPSYPSWENAARYAESAAAFLLAGALASGAVPVYALLSLLLRGLGRAKRELGEEILPGMGERAREAIRIRQRRRWERKHGSGWK